MFSLFLLLLFDLIFGLGIGSDFLGPFVLVFRFSPFVPFVKPQETAFDSIYWLDIDSYFLGSFVFVFKF